MKLGHFPEFPSTYILLSQFISSLLLLTCDILEIILCYESSLLFCEEETSQLTNEIDSSYLLYAYLGENNDDGEQEDADHAHKQGDIILNRYHYQY